MTEPTKRQPGRPRRARWPEVPEAFKGPRKRLSTLDRWALDMATTLPAEAGVVTSRANGGERING